MPAFVQVSPKESQRLGEGERKHVTVLFADIRGSTQLIESLDPEAAMHQLDPALQSMMRAVASHGGVVNDVQGDGIMALFGAPAACEDHAVRACLAARTMLGAIADLNDPNIGIRVGIDSGQVVIRPTGRDASDYGATGAVAHIAHRVEQHAKPGTAALTGRTARLARGYVDLASLGRLEMKGLAEPLEVFQLLDAVARPSWEVRCSVHGLNRFVDRDAERAQLSAASRRAELGCGQVVTLVADAGFGKSRLVHEFLRALPSGSWNVHRVAGMSHTAGAPYHVAAEFLRSWLAVDAADDRAEVARKLKHTLALIDPEGGTDIAPLQSLLDLPLEDEQWPRLAPSTRRHRLMTAMRSTMLREAALHPLILLVEDYHWVDLPSADVLDFVVAGMGAARMLLLVTTRPDRCPDWTRRSYCLHLPLAALEPESAGILLRELLFVRSTDLANLQQQILLQAGGVPLFIEEIARSLTESGIVTSQSPRQGSTGGFGKVVIPESIQAIIAARIDRLSPARRTLLHVASVIGKDVPLNVLQAVADLPHEQLEREIGELQSAEFLYELSLPSGTVYTFRHVLIQTVAYEEMLRSHRRELHTRVVEAMERLFADRLDELTERLADHALRGESWEAAVSYALKAGDRAVGRGAWREAVSFYDSAIEALTHLPRRPETIKTAIEARLRLRVALPGLADLPRIARCLEEARSLAEAVQDPAQLAEIDTSQCLALTKMGRLDQAIEAGRRSHLVARDLGEKAALLNASFALAQACWYRGEFQQAERLVVDCLADIRGELRLKQTGTTGTASVLALVCLSKTYAITGQSSKAFATIAEAFRIGEDTRKPFDHSYCRVGRGFCLLLNDQPGEAASELEEALRLARTADIALLIPSSQRYLGRAYALIGRLREAQEVLEEAIERTSATSLLGMRLWSSAALVPVQACNSIADAHGTLVATLELARQYAFRPLESHLMRLMGNLQEQHAEKPRREAEHWYRDAIHAADEMGMAPEAAQARRDLAACLQHAD